MRGENSFLGEERNRHGRGLELKSLQSAQHRNRNCPNEHVGFADVFWPMLAAGFTAQKQYGTNYAIAGKDGVHPGWAGHTVMAYAFLRALGLNGEIGTFTVDLKKNTMKTSEGHVLASARDGEFQITSSRYPFCACLEEGQAPAAYPVCVKDDVARDDSIHSAM